MGIGAKLTFAFFTVVLVAVLGNAAYSLYLDFQSTRQAAIVRINRALEKLQKDFSAVEQANAGEAQAICQDSSLVTSLNSNNRDSVASIVKGIIAKRSLIGFVTVIDSRGNVFYSSEAPSKFGYSAKDLSGGVDYVLSNRKSYLGAACFSPTDAPTLSSMLPLLQSNRVNGAVIVSQPLDNEFLTGLVTKFAIEQDHLTGIDIAIISKKTGKLMALTPNLMSPSTAGPFINDLEKHGAEALKSTPLDHTIATFFRLPGDGVERGGRFWLPSTLVDVDADPKNSVAYMVLTTPVPELTTRLANVTLLAAACGAISLVFGLIFSAGITKGVNEPLRFLIDRTAEIAEHKTTPPPLEGLSGEWLELGELIDTSVSSMRTSMQSLRSQLNRQMDEVKERSKHADDRAAQLDSLNKQFSTQAKQVSELSKQINNANRQSVILQHKLDSVLQISTEGFLLLDQFGNVLSANPVFLNWIGCSEGEIAGRLCFDLVKRPGEPRSSDKEGKAFARHGNRPGELIGQFYPEGIIYHKTQNKFVEVLAHLQPVQAEDSNIQAYIMVLRDKSLRSEIAQLRGEIVSMLSESIRVPLATAEQQWLTILNSAARTMPPAVGQPLAELHGQYEQLLGIVDSLLMMYGGFVPPPVTPRQNIIISRLVSECLEQISPLARQRQLALDYKSQTGVANITGNREAAKNILMQILEKMITSTQAGGRVRVETQSKGSELLISVSSSGPSLPEGEIADLFAGFVQGKHDEASYSSRLSMYLARNNVERLGGKIWAESEDRRGTAVHFTLPIQ